MTHDPVATDSPTTGDAGRDALPAAQHHNPMTIARPTAKRPRRDLPVWLDSFRQAMRYGRTRIGLVCTLVVVVFAIVGPWFATKSPSEFVGAPFAKPSGTALLGTDALGRDVLARVLHGGRTVIWMSIVAATIGMVIGSATGLLAAYNSVTSTWLDETIMRTSDVLLALPLVVFVLLFVSLLGPSLWLIVLLVGLAHSPQVARIVRGTSLDVVERDFIKYAEAVGIPRRRVLFGEILPNITTPLMVEYGLRIVWSIAGIAGLSLIGYGIQAPQADWGLMINENRVGIAQQPWAVAAPVVCITLFAFGTNMIAEGIARTISGVERKQG
jgi:peptide/nickel transport system permease protein